MYLGSSVPHITKDGLQGIQEPLRELYPDKTSLATGNAGIDSWLSVWSNGILIENVDETGREVKRFFKIDALHYCAAVKYVPQVGSNQQSNGVSAVSNGVSQASLPKFLPLDSPHARMQQNNTNPPIFASILRRTTGVKVLECHAFICKREAAANALVRCCFHAYADTMYAKQIGADVDEISTDLNNNNNRAGKSLTRHSTLKSNPNDSGSEQHSRSNNNNNEAPSIAARRSKSIGGLNNPNIASEVYSMNGDNGNNQHESTYSNTMQHKRSNQIDNYALNGDVSDGSFHQQQMSMNSNLLKQQKLSKSMHHLHQAHEQVGPIYGRPGELNPSTSFHNLSRARWNQQQQQQQDQLAGFHQPMLPPQPFFTPEASRVPSYPPQNLIDQQANNSGTMRSIKSVAGNSIASTLLRSKKHAKAMSMAQMNQQNGQQITSFHQPFSDASTLAGGGSFLMPPVPPMFLQNMPRPLINGSQTMKLPSKHFVPMAGAPMNFESMTPKEMKKLLKKSAKYGIDPSRFSENGLPLLPLRPMPMPGCHPLMSPLQTLPPPQINKSGTIGGRSMFSMDIHNQQGHDMPDLGASMRGLSLGPPGPHMLDPMDPGQHQPIKSILVKPNPEFLKSKAGKKWLKQQKEFKKLLPPHLDGLPIVFGPPPMDALEPAPLTSANNGQQPQFLAPPPPPPHPGVPMMDSSGFYNPHPFYGPSGRASAASTLLRYSPHSQMIHENGANMELDYAQRSQTLYSNAMLSPQSMMQSQQSGYGLNDDASLVYGTNEMGTFDRQYTFNGDGHAHQKRNHMVEQSVISLGDENDVEDEDDEEEDDDDDDDRQGGQHNGYYNRVDNNQSARSRAYESSKPRRNNEHIRALRDQMASHQDYEQVMPAPPPPPPPPNDDQSSHSSGIYRRGHINERAFSYSIRQEHKSSGGSDAEYTSESGQHVSSSSHAGHHNLDHQTIVYDNPHSSDMFNNQYSYNRNQSNNLPVNELATRMENQLNMKSFANSRVKSHM